MFIKGIKHEFRAVARIVMPMLIVLLIASMLMSVTFILDGRVFHFSDALEGTAESDTQELFSILFVIFEVLLAFGLYFLLIASILAVSVMLVYRFYVSFFTDEGYLTFTLPLTITEHLWIKLLSTLIWNTLSLVVALVCIVMILGGAEIGYGGIAEGLPYFFEAFGEVFSTMGTELGFGITHIILSVLYYIVSYAMQSIITYFAICLGCMLVKKHRLLAAIISIFIINGLVSSVTSVISLVLTLSSYAPSFVYLIVMVISIILVAVATIAAYLGTKYILERKLNLD
ncbi:MAG: hypothetical protein IJ489_01745 [Clostridia bacterium]|nr:hypothetical protein [Clostridia bacterium]